MRRIPVTIQIILYILETSLQLDVAVSHGLSHAYYPAESHHQVYLILIGVILILSSAIFNVVSIIWIYRTMDFSGKKVGNAVCILMHILQVGPVWRYFKIVIINESLDFREFLALRTMQTTLQTLPFLVVQGYAMLAGGISHPIHLVSVLVSILSVTMAYISYQGQEDATRYKQNSNKVKNTVRFQVLTWGLLFLVKLLVLSGRILSFVMFIQACQLWIILLLGSHTATYGIIVYLMRRICHYSNITPNLQNSLQSLVHVFDHISPCHQVPKSELIAFYLLVSVENVAMGLVWYLTESAVSFKAMLFAGSLVCLLLGVLLLCLYHGCTSSRIATLNKDIECENHEDISHSATIVSAGDLDTHQRDTESVEVNSPTSSDSDPPLVVALDLMNPSSDRTCLNDTDVLADSKSSRVKTRSHSFSCAMGLNGKVNSEKDAPAGDKAAKDCGLSECESGIDMAQCEAMVDEHWMAGHNKKTICHTEEDGSGYFSGTDGFDIATIHSSLTGGTTSCSLTSFPSPTEVHHKRHYDSGYFSRGDRTSSSSTTSSPKNNPVKLNVIDLQQHIPKSSQKYSFANRYPHLLDTTATVNHNNTSYESSITSCCSCSQRTSTLSSAVISDSDEVSSCYLVKDSKPLYWKTLPPARSKEWQQMIHQNSGDDTKSPEVVQLRNLNTDTKPKQSSSEFVKTLERTTHKKSNLGRLQPENYDSKYNCQQWYKNWNTPYESSLCSSTDLCSQSMYDFRNTHLSDSSSFCSTCDELDEQQQEETADSETDFTMTWPPSNRINRRNLNRLPQDSIPSEEHVAHWLQTVNNCQPPTGLANNKTDLCHKSELPRVLGRREASMPLCTHTKDCDMLTAPSKSESHRSALKHNVMLHGKGVSAKSMLMSFCAVKKSKPKRLYPYNVSGPGKGSVKSSPLIGKETVV